MTAKRHLALLAGVAAAGLWVVACGPGDKDKKDAGTPCDPRVEECACAEASDCPEVPGVELFYCNQTSLTCMPSCRAKADCTAASRGEWALDYCEGNLGCQCDEGTCVAALCSADVDCGANSACRNGKCVAIPAAAQAQRCQITPDFATVKEGAQVQFWVSFWSADNQPVVLKDGITWEAVGDRLSGVTPAEASARFTGGAAGEAVDSVRVTAGSASCTARVRTLSAVVPAAEVRVTVVNELTGRPVQGALVLLSKFADGAQIASATTPADGTVAIAHAGEAQLTISAFHNEFTYLSVVKYPISGSRDLVLALRRNQVDKYGGYKGTFADKPATPNVHAGIAAMSIPGAVTDLSVSQILGHSVPTDVKIGSAINEKDVPLPAGVYLNFMDAATPIKGEVSAQGVAGICTAAANAGDPEAAILAGNCGTRTAWGLAADVPLPELPISALTAGLDNIDYGQLLTDSLPLLKRFSSSVVRDVEFRLLPVANPEDPNFSNTDHFTAGVNHRFNQMPLGFSFAVRVPSLPQFRGTHVDGVALVGGVDVKGRGVVPLGLGVGLNTATPKDDKIDPQAGLGAGLVQMRMAPAHQGLEGSQYGITALAVSLQSLEDPAAGLAVSALYHRFGNNRLVFDPKGEAPVELSGTFINYPEGGRYNFTDAAQPGLAARTFRFVGGKDLSAASVVRVQFTDLADRRWQVLTDPATAAAGFVLPKPGSLGDRTLWTGNVNGERANLMVQALQLKDGATTVSFTGLVEANGANVDRIGDLLTAFSALDHGRPQITWLQPETTGATLAPGATLSLRVSNFRVGTGADADGVVKITFLNGTAACTEQTLSQPSSTGPELTGALPAGCTGQGVEMTATLHDAQGAIKPGVSKKITVNIQ